MLLTRLPDGSLMIECRADQFSAEYKAAPIHERVVLDDRRPAVRKVTDQGITYTTIHPYIWEVLKALPRNRPMVQNKIKLCQGCGSEMKVSREYEGCWCFTCDKCKSVETHDKRLIGGTFGAGEKEKR